MWSSTISTIGLVVLLLIPKPAFAARPAQKYAPVVGRWRVELKIAEDIRSLEFETDGTGRYGLGAGYFVIGPDVAGSREYPAAWSNNDPQRISITGEIFFGRDKSKRGTLVLRTTLAPGQEIKGDAIFIDEELTSHRGSFTMKQILGPEQIRQKDK